jgi:hypothetical protein
MVIEIFYHGKWMAKTYHYTANLSPKQHFSPIGFRSEILQLVEKKTNFCSKKHTSVVYEIFNHSTYLYAKKHYLKNNLHY